MPLSADLDQRIHGLAKKIKHDREIFGHRDHQSVSAKPEVDTKNLKSQLKDLKSRFDPDYKSHHDHGYYARHQAIEASIEQIKRKLKSSGQGFSMEDQVSRLDAKLAKRIAENLVSITDAIELKSMVSEVDQSILISCLAESIANDFHIDDAIMGLEYYIRCQVNEAYVSGTSTNFGTPSQPPAPGAAVQPAPGAQTSAAVKPVAAAANINISGNTVDANRLRRDLETKLKSDPTVSRDFAALLSKLMVKK